MHLFGKPYGRAELARFAASDAGQATRQPYAALVAAQHAEAPAARPAVLATRPLPPPKHSVLARELRLGDRLPFGTGGESFIAEPTPGKARHVRLFLGGKPVRYQRFAQAALDTEQRTEIRTATRSLYLGDRLRAWFVTGGGGLALVGGGAAAIYAFAAGVPLEQRLVLGMGGANLALLGGLLAGVGVVDHLMISLAEARGSKVGVDVAELEARARRYNDPDAGAE